MNLVWECLPWLRYSIVRICMKEFPLLYKGNMMKYLRSMHKVYWCREYNFSNKENSRKMQKFLEMRSCYVVIISRWNCLWYFAYMTKQILYLVIYSSFWLTKWTSNIVWDAIPKHSADNCTAKEAVNTLFYNFFK